VFLGATVYISWVYRVRLRLTYGNSQFARVIQKQQNFIAARTRHRERGPIQNWKRPQLTSERPHGLSMPKNTMPRIRRTQINQYTPLITG
jgi:hypothetical protein